METILFIARGNMFARKTHIWVESLQKGNGRPTPSTGSPYV